MSILMSWWILACVIANFMWTTVTLQLFLICRDWYQNRYLLHLCYNTEGFCGISAMPIFNLYMVILPLSSNSSQIPEWEDFFDSHLKNHLRDSIKNYSKNIKTLILLLCGLLYTSSSYATRAYKSFLKLQLKSCICVPQRKEFIVYIQNYAILYMQGLTEKSHTVKPAEKYNYTTCLCEASGWHVQYIYLPMYGLYCTFSPCPIFSFLTSLSVFQLIIAPLPTDLVSVRDWLSSA